MYIFTKTPRIARAFEMMIVAHQGQNYGDKPYFTHPLEVAMNLTDQSEKTIITALLHDTVEDTELDIDTIHKCFGYDVARSVDLLTKKPYLTYRENIDLIILSKDRSAIHTKWEDNRVNMSGNKTHMPEERRKRLENKYTESFVALTAAKEALYET